jgi:hypothetical protein
MRVIVNWITMETTQDKIALKRRSFFIRLLGGIAGGWIAGNVFTVKRRSTAVHRSNDEVKVRINPLAVSRTKKDSETHGA